MDDIGCVAVFIGGIIAVVVALFVKAMRDERAKVEAQREREAAAKAAQAAARRDYEEALRQLVRDPASAQLRTRALTLGRTYSNYTRNQSGITVFDEVALMNDINAAAAAASAPPPASIEDRLTRLHDLRTRGLISEGEYDERRREILRDT